MGDLVGIVLQVVILFVAAVWRFGFATP